MHRPSPLFACFTCLLMHALKVEPWLFSPIEIGDLSPIDPYIFVGETLNMTCRLKDSAVAQGDNSSKLYFTFGNDIPIPEEDTFIINRSSKGFTQTIETVFDRSYHCNIHNPVSQSHGFVHQTTVRAEYYPRPVTNFNCIIYDWDEKMECKWDLGVDYFNINHITTNLSLGYSGPCPKMQLLNCTWLRSDPVSFDRSRLMFEINVTNTKKDVTVNNGWITIMRDDYVKPSPVVDFTVFNYTSTCVGLKWSHPRRHRRKYFIIKLNSKWGDNKTEETDDISMNITVCDLKPSTTYNITIVTKPKSSNNLGYPSDPVTIVVTTKIDIPGNPPDIGNYYVSYQNCEADRRMVTVYWKKLPDTELNSPTVSYHTEIRYPNGSHVDSNPQTHISFPIPCIHDVNVSIWSKNDAGVSAKSSTIQIPRVNVLTPPSHVIVEAQSTSTDTAVSVSWTPSGDDRYKYHTVYYCQYDTECNDIGWSRVYGDTNYIVINDSKLQFDRKYRFGVSSDTATISSGFKWQLCYYVKSNEPTAPSKVEVQSYPDDSLTVSWSVPECGLSPYIVLYRIRWCIPEPNQSDKCKGIIQEADVRTTEPPKYVINDLLAGTMYGVMVSYITADGRQSLFSEMIQKQPINSDLNEGEITGIAIGALFVVVMSIAGLVFICRRTSRTFKRAFKLPDIDKIEIPIKQEKITPTNSTSSSSSSNNDVTSTSKLIKNGTGNPFYYHQISKDSGRSSLSSEGLGSPNLTSRLFPLPEESACDSFKNHSEKEKTLPSDSDYSKVTHVIGDRQNIAFDQDVVVAPILRNSCPNINDKSFIDHGGSAPKISNTTLASYKSSSEEKVWLDMDDCDNDGYIDQQREKSKSMETVSSKGRKSTDEFESYVKTGETSTILDNSNINERENPSSYIDEATVQSMSIQANQNGTQHSSEHGDLKDENNKPLLEIDEDSCISLISSGCFEESDFNTAGRLISSPELSPHSSTAANSDTYRRLDSIENPQFSDQWTPLISRSSDYLPHNQVQPKENSFSNVRSDTTVFAQPTVNNNSYILETGSESALSDNIMSLNCRNSSGVCVTDNALKASCTRRTENETAESESEIDESNSLLNMSEISEEDGYLPHSFNHS